MEQFRGLIRTEFRQRAGVLELGDSVAGHGKSRHAIQAIFPAPRIGDESPKLKLDRYAGAARRTQHRDISVNPIGEPSQYRSGVGRVARVLLLHVTPVLQGARVDIALQKGRSQDFAEPSLTGTLPQFHLKQAILGGDHPLRKEKVVLELWKRS